MRIKKQIHGGVLAEGLVPSSPHFMMGAIVCLYLPICLLTSSGTGNRLYMQFGNSRRVRGTSVGAAWFSKAENDSDMAQE